MSSQRFSPEFKEEAIRQIVDLGYVVSEVSQQRYVPEKKPFRTT
ncbi:MAG: transposase [Candidatus Thiodiazotropha sp. (ex. Lucinisca nassula)]|nr:transposase [Candidatus Thiodiazotropha sp. (ex. Lucinisca nassula)]